MAGSAVGCAGLLLLALSLAGASSCPSPCQCKWKGGKQAVECVDQALITVPTGVDPETQVLDMSGNRLQELPKEMFVRNLLLNLQRVYLRSCRIGQIDDQAFKGLTNLVELDLSENLLTSVPSATFNDMPFLRDLSLAKNPIQKLESGAFRTVPGLVKLDLSHCELQYIAPKAFEGVELMESLRLNGNRLSVLQPHTVERLQRLHGVELHDNPWHCDCHLRAAKLWLTSNNIPYPVAPVCSGGPHRVQHRTFAELHVDDFACKPEILPVSRYVEATTGENATVLCRVGGVPQADIHWYWNGRLLLNNSVFSPFQRVYVFEEGTFEKTSALVLTNAQDTDQTEFYCVAENRAGSAEANFTLHVSMRLAGISTLGSGQIFGLSAALIVLVLVILLVILVLLVRLRKPPACETKSPGQLEVVATMNGNTVTTNCKAAPVTDSSSERTTVTSDSIMSNNPIQKPPRRAEISYTTSHYNGHGSVLSATHFSPPTSNPDLINDTRLNPPPPAPMSNGHVQGLGHANPGGPGLLGPGIGAVLRPGSGEYSRAGGCDSLYPSGIWDTQSPEHYIRRTTSSTATGLHYDASDKTPIIGDGTSMGGESEDDLEYRSRTLPRPHIGHPGHPGHPALPGHPPPHEDYPPDYGLPIPQAEGAQSPSATSPTGAHPNVLPNAKTLRVWQRGVPVLPPVTALKRVLSSNRNSPDEGYQEGCGTDV
ncbi:hypothetical protein FOCC_FOCC006092 [Frankliniella occidentalis]|uniref:Uncharacterized protein LOC113209578 n=1 Tax=Frankliniella occidentalis TaxID=133901 RepID=A0A6J1SQ81_FRAOC|nr:uncharacterized protein LOC113209578 [Frankliniella occidentalis]KAE8747225.1 hypothetical protein FOCC_FOCC006092 [Frankliniella occidentalis]